MMSFEDDIREFREAFRLPIHEEPTSLGWEDANLHLKLLTEEWQELLAAIDEQDVTETFDAIVDMMYVLAGFGVHMGLPLDAGWAEVHASNMSKLDEDGEPIFREDGKVLKSEQYFAPDLEGLL